MTKRKPPPQKKPGIAIQHLHDTYSTIPDEKLKNGHVLFLYVQNSKSVTGTIGALVEHVPGTLTSANLMKPLVKKFESFNHVSRENEKAKFVKFCEEYFSATYHQQEPERPTFNPESKNASTSSYQQEPERPATESEIASTSTTSSHRQQEPERPGTESENASTSSYQQGPETPATETDAYPVTVQLTPNLHQTLTPCSSATATPARKRLRGNNLTPQKAQMKARLDYVSKERSEAKVKFKRRILNFKRKLNTVEYNKIKYLNQTVNRKTTSLASLKVNNARMNILLKENKKLKKENDKLKSKSDQKPWDQKGMEEQLRQSGELKNLKRIHKRLKVSNAHKRTTKKSENPHVQQIKARKNDLKKEMK